jgi:hypothetical protein
MKELVQYAFDFFAYVIPGLFVLFSISLWIYPIDSFGEAIDLTKKVTKEVATVLVVVSYVVGFIIYPIGRIIYKTFGFKIFPRLLLDYKKDKDESENNSKKEEEKLSLNAKYSLLRELSPTNFKYVESWNIYCAMSHNLMVASLIFSIVSFIRILDTDHALFWAGTGVLGLFIFLVLTHRAVTYSQWAKGDINASIESLNLDSKVD